MDITAPATLPPAYGSAEPDGTFPRTVRHFGGLTTLTEPPTRYVAISTGNLDGALALGVVPVASTHNDSGPMMPEYLRRSASAGTDPRDLDAIVDLGERTAPDLNAIARLEPTLITASYRGFGGRNLTELTPCGPTVLPEGKGYNWKQDLLLLASALGRTSTAQELLEAYAERVTAVRHLYRVAGEPAVSVARFGPTGLETHGTWSFCGSVLTDIGASRPAGQHRHDNGTRHDLEHDGATARVRGLEAPVLLYTRVGLPRAEEAWARAQRLGWPELPAVEEGRAIEVDAQCWHGHAGVLAAHAILDDLETVLR